MCRRSLTERSPSLVIFPMRCKGHRCKGRCCSFAPRGKERKLPIIAQTVSRGSSTHGLGCSTRPQTRSLSGCRRSSPKSQPAPSGEHRSRMLGWPGRPFHCCMLLEWVSQSLNCAPTVQCNVLNSGYATVLAFSAWRIGSSELHGVNSRKDLAIISVYGSCAAHGRTILIVRRSQSHECRGSSRPQL